MGQMEDLRLFVTVVDEGSIARAADALGIAKSAVSRRLQQLEDRYDIKLIDRHPRNWDVTKAGQELYQRAHAMVADADDLDSDFMHTSRSLSGPLRVSVPLEFGLSFLKPTLYAFMQKHPEIDLTVDFEDRTVDLDRENYDLAVRITSQDWTGLNRIKLGETTHRLYASPAYIDKRGPITMPCHLKEHDLLHYGSDRRATWAFDYQGKKTRIEFQPAMNSNLGAFLVDSAVEGLGVIRMLDFITTSAVERSELMLILPEAVFPRHGVYLMHSEKRRLNRRMRALMEALQADCAVLGVGGSKRTSAA